MLTTVLDHFNEFEIPTFVFSLAGISTKVNDKILAKIEKDYNFVTLCQEKLPHAQHFLVPLPPKDSDANAKATGRRSVNRMTSGISNVSNCLEGHFNKKCGHSAHTLSLFEHACGHSDLRMVQKSLSDEMIEKMTNSIKHS